MLLAAKCRVQGAKELLCVLKTGLKYFLLHLNAAKAVKYFIIASQRNVFTSWVVRKTLVHKHSLGTL